MKGASWLFVALLVGCTAQSAEQRDLQAQVAGMAVNTIALACPDGNARALHMLGAGFHLRDGKTVFVCTKALNGGVICTAGDERRILDFEQRTAAYETSGALSETCSF